MSTDLFKRVIFNNGEGLTFQDAIDSQDYLLAKVYDQIISNGIGGIDITNGKDPEFGGQNGLNMPTSRAYCLNPGQAYLRQGSTTNKVQLAPGTLCQKIANITGNAPTLLSYQFDGTSTYEWTLTAGDATNPRVDLLQMSLAYLDGDLQSRDFQDATTRVVTTTSLNKKRQVSCTLSVKAGTPGATPQIPEPDAGCVPVGSVYVGPLYVTGTSPIFGTPTAGAVAVVHDQRMPMRVRAYRVYPQLYWPVTAWSVSSASGGLLSSSATNDMYVPCPTGNIGRIVGIGIDHSAIIGTVTLGYSGTGISASFANRNTVNQITSAGDDTSLFYVWEATQTLPGGVGAVSTPSVTTKIGIPMWTNGKYCPFEKMRLGTPGSVTNDQAGLHFVNAASGCIIRCVTWYIAEGL